MKRFSYTIVWILALAVIAGALLIFESHLLWKEQELNLFLNSALFFKDQLVVPGGMLTWISTFFTQFFYHSWLGMLLLSCWWLLLMWLTKRTFRIPNWWAGIMIIPVGLLLLTIVDMGYWLYMLKLQGHFFVATIGTTALVALLWLFRLLPAVSYLRAAYIFVVCAIGYPLMGIYGLAAALLMGIWSWRLGKGDGAVVNSLVAIISAIAVPLLCYRFVYYQTNLANIYYAELPLYYITEDHQAYYIPFYLLALFYVVMTLLPASLKAPVKPLRPILVQAVLGVALVYGVFHFWYKDENFHRELAMQHSVWQQDWEGVLKEAAKQKDEPTRAIVMMKNLALMRLGRQGSDMFLYKNGSKRYNAPFGMRLMLVVGPMMYYEYGLLNYCSRLCIEMGVEFGWRAEYLKMLAKCAILRDERTVARKYLGLLKQTAFFDDWARETESLLGHPELIAKDSEMGIIVRMMHFDNNLSSDHGNIERFLMNQLVMSTNTDDPLFQEQTLLATLWTHDIGQFWRHFSDYIRLHPNVIPPRYFQEAAYLYGKLENRPNLDRMPFDEGVKTTFERFMEESMKYNDTDIDYAREHLYPFFGQTYYFDYYIMSQLPEY